MLVKHRKMLFPALTASALIALYFSGGKFGPAIIDLPGILALC